MIFIFLGPPGAGKGTQAQLLGQKLNLPVISMGQLLRDAHKRGESEGVAWWRDYGRLGLNAPVSLKSKILMTALDNAAKGFILDGFPKTKEDLAALKQYLQKRQEKIDRVFHLVISDKVAIGRILNRKQKGERADDDLKLLKVRIKEGYRRDLKPILEYFRGLRVLEEINASGSIKSIHEEILKRF